MLLEVRPTSGTIFFVGADLVSARPLSAAHTGKIYLANYLKFGKIIASFKNHVDLTA